MRRGFVPVSVGSPTPMRVAVATYLDALAEVRRALLREPATEWETGLLIRLYAETTGLQARPSYDPSIDVGDGKIARRPGRWDVVPRRIVEVAEAMICREYPEQVAEILRWEHLVESQSGRDEPRLADPAGTLNAIADQIVLKDGAAMRAVWLTSFRRPASWERGDEVTSQLHTADFRSACADLARGILADAGPTASSLTTALSDSVVAAKSDSSR